VSFDPYAIRHILKAISVQIGDSVDVESIDVLYDLPGKHKDGWSIDPDSLMNEYLLKIFPLPGLSQFEYLSNDELESADEQDVQAQMCRRVLEATGLEFHYSPGKLLTNY
jgi:hypothetical protein